MHALNRLAAAAFLVALAPRPALAVGPPLSSVKVYCQPGSLNNCFAFAIQSEDGHITYWLQNLQGSIAPGGTAFGIQGYTVGDFMAVGIAIGSTQLSPMVQYSARQSFEGSVRRGNGDIGPEREAISSFSTLYVVHPSGPGIIGCINPAFPPGDLTGVVAQTCLPTGLDGFVRFDADATILQWVRISPQEPDVLTHRPADQEDFYFIVAGCDVYSGSRSGGSTSTNCSTNISYADLRASFTTAPEPSSIALVGSGLLGTGLFGRRRRKS